MGKDCSLSFQFFSQTKSSEHWFVIVQHPLLPPLLLSLNKSPPSLNVGIVGDKYI
jgi:hypothetical protein